MYPIIPDGENTVTHNTSGKDKINPDKIFILLKKIHPDISPETARLSTIVNEAKEIVLKDIS